MSRRRKWEGHDTRGGQARGRPRVVGVVGGSGGVGTSCLAAALATRARSDGWSVVCADAGAWGGGIDALFDLESRPGVRWPDLAEASGRLDGAVLLRHLPESAGGVRVLSAATTTPDEPGHDPGRGTPAAAAAAVFEALTRVVDVLVLDLGTVPAAGLATAWGEVGCTDLLLVVGTGVPALARAGRAAEALTTGACEQVWLVQRCPRGRADLAELVAERLGLPLLGVVPDDPRLDDALARGEAPGSGRSRLGAVAHQLWTGLTREERVA